MSAWDVFWLLFIFIPLAIIWVMVLADTIRRPDLTGVEKALWVAVIIFFPWLGALAYLIFRPATPMSRQPLGAAPGASVPQETPTQPQPRPSPQATPTA